MAKRVQKSARVVVRVDADIEAVWNVVRDPTRVGEWSHECVEAKWLGGSNVAEAGARFRGRNRSGPWRWGRICEVVSCEPYRIVWRTVSTRLYRDTSEWSIALTRDGAGTQIEQRFDVMNAPKILDVIFARLLPNHRDRDAALAEDLRRLGALALTEPTPVS